MRLDRILTKRFVLRNSRSLDTLTHIRAGVCNVGSSILFIRSLDSRKIFRNRIILSQNDEVQERENCKHKKLHFIQTLVKL